MIPLRRYCTYFDSRYASRGLALYRSLERHGAPFELTVLALDESSELLLPRLDLPGLRVLPLAELESAEPRLLEAKPTRSRVEYYFTCTSSLVMHLLRRSAPGEVITYLDADLWFLSSPEPLFAELEGRSVLIVPHRFPPRLEHLNVHGVYNVGWLSFANDAAGLECAGWWRDRCLEWCYDRVEDGKFADQRYLDDWPTRFAGVRVLQHPGGGVAPWNVGGMTVRAEEGRVFVDEIPLVFYHFHALKQLGSRTYDSGLAYYRTSLDREVRRVIYAPYIRELRDIERWLAGAAPAFVPSRGSMRSPGRAAAALVRGALRGNLIVWREPARG